MPVCQFAAAERGCSCKVRWKDRVPRGKQAGSRRDMSASAASREDMYNVCTLLCTTGCGCAYVRSHGAQAALGMVVLLLASAAENGVFTFRDWSVWVLYEPFSLLILYDPVPLDFAQQFCSCAGMQQA
jgi:hypothetical protein